MPELLQEFFEDKEKFAVLVPGLIALIVLLVAYGQWRTLKKEETRWRAWMRLLLAFGFVFGCFCLDRLTALRSGGAEAASSAHDTQLGPVAVCLLIAGALVVLYLCCCLRGAGDDGGYREDWPPPTPPPPRMSSRPHTRPNLLTWLKSPRSIFWSGTSQQQQQQQSAQQLQSGQAQKNASAENAAGNKELSHDVNIAGSSQAIHPQSNVQDSFGIRPRLNQPDAQPRCGQCHELLGRPLPSQGETPHSFPQSCNKNSLTNSPKNYGSPCGSKDYYYHSSPVPRPPPASQYDTSQRPLYNTVQRSPRIPSTPLSPGDQLESEEAWYARPEEGAYSTVEERGRARRSLNRLHNALQSEDPYAMHRALQKKPGKPLRKRLGAKRLQPAIPTAPSNLNTSLNKRLQRRPNSPPKAWKNYSTEKSQYGNSYASTSCYEPNDINNHGSYNYNYLEEDTSSSDSSSCPRKFANGTICTQEDDSQYQYYD